MPKLSQTAISILTLLNNISELIVRSNNRQEAKDVMRALKVYADNKTFPMPEDKVDTFYSILIDSRPYTLADLLKSIASDVIVSDKSR